MAAKKVRISNDGGSTWADLPGSQASFNNEAEGIDDTILGNTYNSSEIGLLTWTISSDGVFKGFAGYLAELKKVGSTTAFTTEACTLVSGKTYSIDDAAKEIWDRSVTIVVWDNGSPVAASDILSFDYLYGQVTFVSTYSVTGPVTLNSGSYFPTVAIGKGNAYTLTMTADAIDTSDFATTQANSGNRTFSPGLRTVGLEINGIFDSTENAKADLTARNELIVDIDPAGDGSSIARGFFKIVSTEQGGSVGALEEETVTFNLTVPDDAKMAYVFNWRHSNTTLNLAIQYAITSWISELNTYDVQYLPTGVEGESPLNGAEGNMMLTDISLSGGLSNINVFNIEMTGTGAYTEV